MSKIVPIDTRQARPVSPAAEDEEFRAYRKDVWKSGGRIDERDLPPLRLEQVVAKWAVMLLTFGLAMTLVTVGKAGLDFLF